MEQVLEYLGIYSPALVAIITCIISILTCIKNVKGAVKDNGLVSRKVIDTLNSVTTENFELKVKLAEVEERYKTTLQAVIHENTDLMSAIELLKKQADELESTKRELNQIKKQLTQLLKGE